MFDYDIVNTIVNRIVEKFSPQKIIVFGSVASHTATEGSDVDILVVMDTKDESFYRSIPIDICLRDIIIDKDVIVVTPEEYELKKDDEYSFVNDIVKTGYVAYEV